MFIPHSGLISDCSTIQEALTSIKRNGVGLKGQSPPYLAAYIAYSSESKHPLKSFYHKPAMYVVFMGSSYMEYPFNYARTDINVKKWLIILLVETCSSVYCSARCLPVSLCDRCSQDQAGWGGQKITECVPQVCSNVHIAIVHGFCVFTHSRYMWIWNTKQKWKPTKLYPLVYVETAGIVGFLIRRGLYHLYYKILSVNKKSHYLLWCSILQAGARLVCQCGVLQEYSGSEDKAWQSGLCCNPWEHRGRVQWPWTWECTWYVTLCLGAY